MKSYSNKLNGFTYVHFAVGKKKMTKKVKNIHSKREFISRTKGESRFKIHPNPQKRWSPAVRPNHFERPVEFQLSLDLRLRQPVVKSPKADPAKAGVGFGEVIIGRLHKKQRPSRAAQKEQQRKAAQQRRRRQKHHSPQFKGVKILAGPQPVQAHTKLMARARAVGVQQQVATALFCADSVRAYRIVKEAERRAMVPKKRVKPARPVTRAMKAAQRRNRQPELAAVFQRGTKGSAPTNWKGVPRPQKPAAKKFRVVPKPVPKQEYEAGVSSSHFEFPAWESWLQEAAARVAATKAALEADMGFKSTDTVVAMMQEPQPQSQPEPVLKGRQDDTAPEGEIMMLTVDQQRALTTLRLFLETPKEEAPYAILTGFAGTGKTTLLSMLVAEFSGRVVFTAFTNKAVNVISKMVPAKYCCMTLHRMLGLKQEFSGPKLKFSPDFGVDSCVEYYDLIVVDEASMVPKELLEALMTQADLLKKRAKVLFVGDPAQLPPVGEERSGCFDVNTVYKTQLSQVMRYKNAHIGKLITYVRDNIGGNLPDFTHKVEEDGSGIHVLGRADFESVYAQYVSEHYLEEEFGRALAWTNARVNELNTLARKSIFGVSAAEYCKDDLVVFDQPYDTFSVSDEVRVLEASKAFEAGWNVWRLLVATKRSSKLVVTLAESDKDKYEKYCQSLANQAKSFTKGSYEAKQAWKAFFGAKQAYAVLKYGYAMTVHKSQGSTYPAVFADMADIGRRKDNPVELSKLAYVALSRTSHVIYVLDNSAAFKQEMTAEVGNMETLREYFIVQNLGNDVCHVCRPGDVEFSATKNGAGFTAVINSLNDSDKYNLLKQEGAFYIYQKVDVVEVPAAVVEVPATVQETPASVKEITAVVIEEVVVVPAEQPAVVEETAAVPAEEINSAAPVEDAAEPSKQEERPVYTVPIRPTVEPPQGSEVLPAICHMKGDLSFELISREAIQSSAKVKAILPTDKDPKTSGVFSRLEKVGLGRYGFELSKSLLDNSLLNTNPLYAVNVFMDAWLRAATHEATNNRPVPHFPEGYIYVQGAPIFASFGKKNIIGDLDILMLQQHGKFIDEFTAPNLASEDTFNLVKKELRSLDKKLGKYRNKLSADEKLSLAVAVVLAKVSQKPNVKVVIAAHLFELLPQIGVAQSEKFHLVNAGWNLPAPVVNQDRLIAISGYLVNQVNEYLGMQNAPLKYFAAHIEGSEAAGNRVLHLYVCGNEFIVEKDFVYFNDNGVRKQINSVVWALPIQYRDILPTERTVISAHGVLAYILANVVMPTLSRSDAYVYPKPQLKAEKVRLTYFHAAASIATFLQQYCGINQRGAAITESAQSKALTKGEHSVVVKWYKSLFTFAKGAIYRPYVDYNKKENVNGQIKTVSADRQERMLFEAMALKTSGYANLIPVIETLITQDKLYLQPQGSMTVVDSKLHLISFTQEEIAGFFAMHGFTDIAEIADMLECNADWVSICSKFAVAMSNKDSKASKRITSGVYGQTTPAIDEVLQAVQFTDAGGFMAKVVSVLIAKSWLSGGPGVAYANVNNPIVFTYRKGGATNEYKGSQLYVLSSVKGEIEANSATGWQRMSLNGAVKEGQEIGLYVCSNEVVSPLRAEHTGDLEEVIWRVVDKYGDTDVLEVRVFYRITESNPKIRNGLKAMVVYSDHSYLPERLRHVGLVVGGDCYKVADTLFSGLYEAAQSLAAMPEGELTFGEFKANPRDMLRDLNRRAAEREGLEGAYDCSDMLYINKQMLAEGAYNELRDLFERIFGQQILFSFENCPEQARFHLEFYNGLAAAGNGWIKVVTGDCTTFVDNGGDISDPKTNVITIEGDNFYHRTWGFASAHGYEVLYPITVEYTTVEQSVNTSPMPLNVMAELSSNPEVNPKVGEVLLAETVHNQVHYAIMHLLANKGFAATLSHGDAVFSIEGKPVTVRDVGRKSMAEFFSDEMLGKLAEAYLKNDRSTFMSILIDEGTYTVYRFCKQDQIGGGQTYALLYLPALQKYGANRLDETEGGVNLSSLGYELFLAWYLANDAWTPVAIKYAADISNTITKLCDGERMEKSVAYGKAGVGAKAVALPNIPVGEIWVLKGGKVYKNLISGGRSKPEYGMVVRAPMSRPAVYKFRYISKEENATLPWKVNGVCYHISPFGQYFNMGDFDGDGITVFDATEFVNKGWLAVDNYDSLMKFLRETLGYDMMAAEFWGSGAPEQYYADHFNIPSYASVQKKQEFTGFADGKLLKKKSHATTLLQVAALITGAYAQQTTSVSDTFKMQYWATLVSAFMNRVSPNTNTGLMSHTQLQALYEATLGGYDPTMLLVLFGSVSQAFRMQTSAEWWLPKLSKSAAEQIDGGKNQRFANQVLSQYGVVSDLHMFSIIDPKDALEAMYKVGLCWQDGEKDIAQGRALMRSALLAGIFNEHFVAEPTATEFDDPREAIFAEMFAANPQFACAMLVAQELMDISRNKRAKSFGPSLVNAWLAKAGHLGVVVDNPLVELLQRIYKIYSYGPNNKPNFSVSEMKVYKISKSNFDNGSDDDGGINVNGPGPKDPGPAPCNSVEDFVNSIQQSTVTLTGTSSYLAKDQDKANKANKFIGQGSPKSSTAQYALDFGVAANCGNYSPEDVVFISAEGNRTGRLDPNFAEIVLATKAGASFVTDDEQNRQRPYNVGERQVAEFLMAHSYEEVKPGFWQSCTVQDLRAVKS